MKTTPPPPVDVAMAVPALAGLGVTTCRLHPRQGIGASLSRFGGAFVYPVGFEHPRCSEHGSQFIDVLQLSITDVPELGFPPGSDLFQVLWCPLDHESTYFAPLPVTLWSRAAEGVERLTLQPARTADNDKYLPIPCSVFPERVVEYPDIFELSEGLVKEIEDSTALDSIFKQITEYEFDDPATLYQYWLSVAAGSKVGGYVDWIQDPEIPQCRCGRSMTHLLTIASAEFDGGNWGRWLAMEDRAVWGAEYRARNAVQCAVGLMIGDMGALYLFICRTCPEWPTAAISQCS